MFRIFSFNISHCISLFFFNFVLCYLLFHSPQTTYIHMKEEEEKKEQKLLQKINFETTVLYTLVVYKK